MKHTTSYTLLKTLLSLIAGLTWISSCTTPPEPGMTEQDQSMRDMSGDMFDMFDVELDIEPEVDLVDMNTHDMEDMNNTPLEDYEPPELTHEQQQVHTLLLEAYEAACNLKLRCFPTLFYMEHVSLEDCVQRRARTSYMRHEMPFISATPTQAQECVDAWNDAQCFDQGHFVELERKSACQFKGTKTPGESCFHHFACDSGFCSYKSYNGNHTLCHNQPVCMPDYYEGQPCEREPFEWFKLCPPGMKCYSIEGVESCRPLIPAFEGDCRTYDNIALGCDGHHLYCNTDNGICTPYATEGESCEDTSCFSLEKLKCPLFVENPTCEKVPDEDYYIEEGKSCRARGHRCTPGTECFGQGFETCQKPLPAGSPCIPVFEHCTYGYWCDPDTQRCESEAISNACFQTD